VSHADAARSAGSAPVRRGAALAGLVAVCAVAAGTLRATGLRVNLSPSLPIGIYLAEPLTSATELRDGWLVTVCLPTETARWGRSRGYLVRGSCADGAEPVGKPVFAVFGDTVLVTERGLGRGGGEITANSRPLSRDATARVLPHVARGRYVVRPGEVWLLSTYAASSWDSRYYGPVPAERAVGRLRPLWVVGSDAAK
jgi:conjugative transfer signal peptidase TraF